MAGKVYITPLFRLVWHEMMVRALGEWHAIEGTPEAENVQPLPNVAPCVGVTIGTYFNNNSAQTFVGQETIAKDLGISPRLVFASIRGLQARGLLLVRHGGRKSNTYEMPIEKVAAECELTLEKYRSRVRTSPQERSQKVGAKVAAGCERTLSSPTEKIINSSVGARPKSKAWQRVKHRLADSLGPDVVASWFEDVADEGIDDGVATLIAPSKLSRDRISTQYADHVIRAMHDIGLPVQRVRVLHRISPSHAGVERIRQILREGGAG